MARLFDDASTHYLEHAAAVVAAPPLSMACWFRSDDTTNGQVLMSISTSGGTGRHALAAAGQTGGDPVAAQTVTSAAFAATANSTTGYTANAWYHAAGVWATGSSRAAFIGGGSKEDEGTGAATGTVNVTNIGTRYSAATRGAYMLGRIAEAGIWNVALTDDEVFALARGIRPVRVRRESLVAYWPLWGLHSPEIDAAAGLYPMTVTGATLAEHAPVVPNARRLWGSMPLIEVAAGGLSIPVAMHHRRQQGMS